MTTSTVAPASAVAAVLIVSELAAEASALGAILQNTQQSVVLVNSAAAAAGELQAREFAAVIYAMNAGQAVDSTGLRASRLNAQTPLIFLTPPGCDHAKLIRSNGTGIVDCVHQPVDDFVLRTKVKMFVDMFRSNQRLRDVEAQGSGLLLDSLTNLPNRVLFIDRADQAMRHAARGGGRVAVAVMDLEQVRDVKDTLGPMTGDELLRQIAIRLTAALRRSDTVARIGDTAFGAVLACDTRDGVQTVTSRLERVMADPFVVGGHRITLGGGIGVALFPEHGRDPRVLIERANAVMVIAKQNSMGHLFYDPIHHGDSDDNADSAEMNADELFRVSAA